MGYISPVCFVIQKKKYRRIVESESEDGSNEAENGNFNIF